MNEDERMMAERVSCLAAGCLLLLAFGSVVAGALIRWRCLRVPAIVLACAGLAAAGVCLMTCGGRSLKRGKGGANGKG